MVARNEANKSDVAARMHQLIVSGELNRYLHRTGFYRESAPAREIERRSACKRAKAQKGAERRKLVTCTRCNALTWKYDLRSPLCKHCGAQAREQRKRAAGLDKRNSIVI